LGGGGVGRSPSGMAIAAKRQARRSPARKVAKLDLCPVLPIQMRSAMPVPARQHAGPSGRRRAIAPGPVWPARARATPPQGFLTNRPSLAITARPASHQGSQPRQPDHRSDPVLARAARRITDRWSDWPLHPPPHAPIRATRPLGPTPLAAARRLRGVLARASRPRAVGGQPIWRGWSEEGGGRGYGRGERIVVAGGRRESPGGPVRGATRAGGSCVGRLRAPNPGAHSSTRKPARLRVRLVLKSCG